MTLFIGQISRLLLIISLLISFLGTPVVGKDVDKSIRLTPENIHKQSRCKFDIQISPAYEPGRKLNRQMEVRIKVDSKVPELKNSNVEAEFYAGTFGHFFLKSQIKDGEAVFFLSVTPEILEKSRLVLDCSVPKEVSGSFSLMLRDFLTEKQSLEIKKLKQPPKIEAGTKLRKELAMLDFETGETGLTRDLRSIRKTVELPSDPPVQASSKEASEAAARVLERLNFVGMSKENVLWILGDPATVSDYGIKAEAGADKPLIYRISNGLGGIDYYLVFQNGLVVRVDKQGVN